MVRARPRPRRPARVALAVVAAVGLAVLIPVGVNAASAALPSASWPTSCEISSLPEPDGAWSKVTGGDPTGRYLVGVYGKDGFEERPVLWDNGALHVIDSEGKGWVNLEAVNEDGVAVGHSFRTVGEDTVDVPWVYRDGKLSKLPGVQDATANDINARGDILGKRSHAGPLIVWWAGSDGPVELPLPTGLSWGGLADDGTVVASDGNHVRALRPDGAEVELLLPAVGDINTIDYVQVEGNKVAATIFTSDEDVSVVWDLDAIDQPVVVSRQFSGVQAVNENSWIVGRIGSGTPDQDVPAFASIGGGDLPLPGLPGDPAPIEYESANAVSADGHVLGGVALDAEGTRRAVTWNCS